MAWLVWAVGWPAITANLALVGAWFFLLVAIYFFAQLAFVIGWWFVIEPRPALAGFRELFAVYLAGDSVNYLGANVAGEPVKAHLLGATTGLGRGIASITIHKHADLLSQWMFATLGVILCLWRFRLPRPAQWAALAGVAGLGGLLLLFGWALRRGTYSPILRRLSAWKPLSSRLRRHQPRAEAVDARIQAFYASHRGRFIAATAWCFAGWCGGLLETYLVLRLLAPSQGWAAALVIESLAMVLNNMLLFIPGRVGSAEGIRAAVFVLLGLPAAQGVAYGLVRRARELAWVLPGLLVLLKRQAGGLMRRPVTELPSLVGEELGH